VDPEVVAALAPSCRVVINETRATLPREEVLRRAGGAEAVMAFMPDVIDEDFLARCPRLRIVAGAFKGHDNIDLGACERRGVCVTTVNDLLTVPTAELAIGLLLALSRNIVEGDRYVRAGAFAGWQPRLYGSGLHASTVGLVGMGAVGRAVADRLTAFGTRIVYSDPEPPPAGSRIAAVRLELSDVLRTSDFLVVTAPLLAGTRHLIDGSALAQMKERAYLVNVGRGSVVDEEAVNAALASGRLRGYATDVFAFEDLASADRPSGIHAGLLSLRRATVLTPHLGSAVEAARRAIELEAASSILEALRGEVPRAAVEA
jgi:phosphonate dehydrogenase